MTTDHYPFISSRSDTMFTFESVSESSIVQKIILYRVLSVYPLMYNLALLDVVEENIVTDNVISNNGDMPKVLATVIRSLFRFFSMHPSASVYITGNTPAKTRLYRIVINRELAEMKKYFEIYGETVNGRELYTANTDYKAFVITSIKKRIKYGSQT